MAATKTARRNVRAALNLNDPRYPRRGGIKTLRSFFLWSWPILAAYLGNAARNLYLLAHDDFSKLSDPVSVGRALTLPAPLATSSTPLWVYCLFLLPCGIVLIGFTWAKADAALEDRIERGQDLADVLHTIGAQTNFGDANVLAPQGPPFDDLKPPDPFVGRAQDLDWMLRRLHRGRGTLAVLNGLPGIGKTAVAAEALRLVRNEGRYRDGVVVVDCTRLQDPTDVLQRVLGRLDPKRRKPATTDIGDLSTIAQNLLEGKEVLVVLDNIEPGSLVEYAAESLRGAGATLVLTARQQLARVAVPVDARHVVELLSPREALDLFAQSYGRKDASYLNKAEYGAAGRIVVSLGNHTLAVKLAAASAVHLGQDLERLAQDLEDPRNVFKLPDGETPRAVAAAFAQSTKLLPPDAQQAFAALAALPTMTFGRDAALSLFQSLELGSPEDDNNLLVLRALVEATTDNDIIESRDRERLRLHPLLRAFARMEFVQWEEQRQKLAHDAVAEYYADRVLDMSDAARLTDEDNLVWAIVYAHEVRDDETLAELCIGMSLFWLLHGRTDAGLRYLPWGIDAAQSVFGDDDDPDVRQIVSQLTLVHAQILRQAGKLDVAEQTLQTNLSAEQATDPGSAVQQLNALASIAMSRGNLSQGIEYMERTVTGLRSMAEEFAKEDPELGSWFQEHVSPLEDLLEAFRGTLRVSDRNATKRLRSTFKTFAMGMLTFLEELRPAMREMGGEEMDCVILMQIGVFELIRGNQRSADQSLRAALVIARKSHITLLEAGLLSSLSAMAVARRRFSQAESYARESLRLVRAMGTPLLEIGALAQLGQTALKRRKVRIAAQYFKASLEQARAIGVTTAEITSLVSLGQCALRRLQFAEALRYLREALAIQRLKDYTVGEDRLLHRMAVIALLSGHIRDARRYRRERRELVRASRTGILANPL